MTAVRPLGVGELLDAAFKLVRRHVLALATVAIVVSVPLELLRGLITVGTTDFCIGVGCENTFGQTTAFTYTDDATYFSGQAVIAGLSALQYVLVQLACFRIVAEGYLGREAGAGASMRFALARGGSTLWLSLLLILSVGLGLLLLIVPGVWLAVSFCVAIPVLLIERKGGGQALRRSFDLVQGRWWPTLGRLLIAYLLIGVGAAVIGFVLALPVLLIVERASYGGVALTGIVNVVTTMVTTPFLAAVTLLIYVDLRTRKEGLDLALLAAQVGGGEAAASPPAPQPGAARDAFGRPPSSSAPRTQAPPASAADWGPPAGAGRRPGEGVPEAEPERREDTAPRVDPDHEPRVDPNHEPRVDPNPERRDEPEPPDLGGFSPPRPGP